MHAARPSSNGQPLICVLALQMASNPDVWLAYYSWPPQGGTSVRFSLLGSHRSFHTIFKEGRLLTGHAYQWTPASSGGVEKVPPSETGASTPIPLLGLGLKSGGHWGPLGTLSTPFGPVHTNLMTVPCATDRGGYLRTTCIR